jgi:phosphoribosyl 1,2-cyclic phosphodiesterase
MRFICNEIDVSRKSSIKLINFIRNSDTPFFNMSLFIASLNSGSNGNCYYVGNDQEAVLIDAGISCRETEIRMKRLGLLLRKVKAIFISHEHSDHINGVSVLSKKYQIPVYVTPETKRGGRLNLKENLAFSFVAYQPVLIGNLSITPFPKLHDASDPHSFVVASDTVNVGVFTDIGSPCEHVIRNFKQCHAVFLESNYDEEMLEMGRYPIQLKNRIRDGKGHLSNRQALDLFLQHRPSFMSHLLLSHLSAENNSQRIVRELFREKSGDTKIIIATRSKETPVYHIRHTTRRAFASKQESYSQLSLF